MDIVECERSASGWWSYNGEAVVWAKWTTGEWTRLLSAWEGQCLCGLWCCWLLHTQEHYSTRVPEVCSSVFTTFELFYLPVFDAL